MPSVFDTGTIRIDTSDEPPIGLPRAPEEPVDDDDVRVTGAPPPSGEFGSITALLGEIEGRESDAAPRDRTITIGPEGTAGPSWQDPTALEVGSGEERRAGRNVPLAAATGFVLAALAVGTLWLGAPWFAWFAGIAVLVGLDEWYRALRRADHQPAIAVGLVSALLILAAAYLRGEAAMLAMLPLSIIATFLWFLAQAPGHRRDVVMNIAMTLLGVGYIGVMAGYGMLILRLPDGASLLTSVIGLTIAYDTAAFFGGYLWGSRPLAASVSPKKSWEGAIGGTIAALALAIGAVAPAVELLDTIGRAAGLAVVVAIFAPLGDLAESILKRDLGLKDMGNILPGHGGVLDRIDALLFVLPASFIFLRLVAG
ncbi:MAG: phosphatidate cytidylyltransferase [Actinomycetota bacterium]